MVDLETVENAANQLYEHGHLLPFLLDQLSEIERRIVIAAASVAEPNTGQVTASRLRGALGKGKIKLSQIKTSLEKLLTNDILIQEDHGNYRFALGIFQRWIVKKVIPYIKEENGFT